MKILVFLLILFCCGAGCSEQQTATVKPTLASRLQPMTFTVVHSVSGDFDGDGEVDQAAVIQLKSQIKPEAETETLNFWPPDSEKHQPEQMLVLVMNSDSDAGKTYLLTADYTRFDTPSFELIVAPKGATIPEAASAQGDILILPTEAGIDEYLFFKDGTLSFIAPEELP